MAADAPCLVTGGAGFAGRHLVGELRAAGHTVTAPLRAELDLREAAATREHVARVRPARVFHLAALASVGRSWDSPAETLAANQEMTVNVLEAVRHEAPQARVLVAGSGEVYGPPAELPLTEEAPLRPRSPYAVSKVGCELLGELYADVHGLHVVRTRAFNHAGPGQTPDFVVGSITRQAALAALAGEASATVVTGAPSVARDFCDVRDVVRAYRLAIEAAPGVYNVASGRARSVSELVAALGAVAGIEIRQEADPRRARPHDTPVVFASAARLESATRWRPEVPLERTLSDTVAAWKAKLQAA